MDHGAWPCPRYLRPGSRGARLGSAAEPSFRIDHGRRGDAGGTRRPAVVLTRSHLEAPWTRARCLGLLTGRARRRRTSVLASCSRSSSATSASGHAAEWGDVRPIAANDWLHVTASGVWTGGLLDDDPVSEPAPWTRPPSPVSRRISHSPSVSGRRRGDPASQCLAALRRRGVVATPYGRTRREARARVGLIALGAANRYGILPRRGRGRPRCVSDRGPAAVRAMSPSKSCSRRIRCTAVLRELSPRDVRRCRPQIGSRRTPDRWVSVFGHQRMTNAGAGIEPTTLSGQGI